MRLVPAAALALIALPAHAQRVDTRVIDIREAQDGQTTCRFNAMPDMLMEHGPARTYARWEHRAVRGGAVLHATFTRKDPQGSIDEILVPAEEIAGKAARARILLDGRDSGMPVAIALPRAATPPVRFLPGDPIALAGAMRYTDTLALVLYDEGGNSMQRHEFFIGDLQDVAERPAIIGWKCRDQ